MTARIAAQFGVVLLTTMAMLATGCTQRKQLMRSSEVMVKPVDAAPKFALSTAPAATITTVSQRAEPRFSIVDSRPDFEKQYYPGQTDPHCWRDAMTVLPLESFQPQIDTAIKRGVLDAIAEPQRYTKLTCNLTSFHVALDERSRAEEDLLYGYKEWDDDRERELAENEQREKLLEEQDRKYAASQRRLGLSVDDDDDESFGDVLAKTMFQAAVVKPIQRRRLQNQKTQQLKVHPQSLPTDLTEGKRAGWNCRIEMTVVAETSTGRTAQRTLDVVAHLDRDGSQPVETQVQQVVNEAVRKLSQQAVEAGL